MSRISLILTVNPYQAEVFVRYKKTDGIFETEVALVDTGAETSLFPKMWLNTAEHKLADTTVVIEQAGIAKQSFDAFEAEIILKLEDSVGNVSAELRVSAWFAETDKVIIGFKDILDRAILHVDFLDTRTGWLEIR
jgi:hypothetical protein